MKIEKAYLGDAVYVDYDGYHLRLTTSGLSGNNEIYLEPNVMKNLMDYNNHILELRNLQLNKKCAENISYKDVG